MTLGTRLTQLSSDVVLSFVERGRRSPHPILFVHGYTDSWRSFETVLRHLPADTHAIAVTLRGHGESSHPVTGYRMTDFAGDLARLLDSLECDDALVVGHSMGGHVAQRFALDFPDRVRGLVLVATFSALPSDPAVRELGPLVGALEDPIDPAFVRDFQVSTLARPIPPERLDGFVAESLCVPARVWREVWAGMRDSDTTAALGDVTAPTLVIWGDRDAIFSREAQAALVAGIPAARFLVYEGHGHALHWEDPRRFAADVVAFADGRVERRLSEAVGDAR